MEFNKDIIALSNEETIELNILTSNILHELGIPAHIKGYHYIRFAIILTVKQPFLIHSVTKSLYPIVAYKFDSTVSNVERAMRHAIEVAWDRGDVDVLNSFFGFTVDSKKGRPTNREFIAQIADDIMISRYKSMKTSKS
ncbi:MAG: sporulation initiation factor Spo0A C-terminal domain-containing protein [Clostridia bacterium]|nr:sporulation initiation factor Spo0A C-terminal domain-containing protein [Clostridia bacterium]